MKNKLIRLRWLIARAALRVARAAALKDCDYGERLTTAVDGFFFYTSHGYMPPPQTRPAHPSDTRPERGAP